MARNLSCVLLLGICTLVSVVYSSQASNAFGQFEKSTTLKCPLKPVDQIEWYDWVYNTNGDSPAAIYKDGVITEDEYHGGRFSVDPSTGHLTISELNDDDIGIYYCNTSATNKHEFDLILTEKPQCQGQVTKLREDDETKLKCDMKYSGGQAPKLEWLREDETLSNAEDKNEIGRATQEITIKVTADMDQNDFICRAVIGEMVEDCTLKFEVKYKVREPVFKPKKPAYKPGATVECVIKGNPVPKVKVTLPDDEIKEGDGAVTVVIPNEWEATNKFIHCEGNNEVDGVPFTTAMNYTFSVVGKDAPTSGENTGDGSEGEGSGGNNQLAGIVAGLVIGAVVLIIIIVAVVCIKKRKSKPPKGSKPVPTKEDGVKDEPKV